MPELGVVSLIHDDQPLNTMVDFAIEHEFGAIELHGKHHNAEKLSDEEVRYLLGVSDSAGIAFNMHFHHGSLPGSHRASVWNETLASFKRNIECVQRLGGSVIVLHPGQIDVPTLTSPQDGSELIRREAIRNLKRFVRRSVPEAERCGVMIALENEKHDPGWVVRSYEDLASVVDDAESEYVGIALDVGHCIIRDGLPQAIDVLGQRIRHLHLNDAIDGSEHKEIGILYLDEMAPLVSGRFDIEFATLEVGARAPEGDGIILRSREALRHRFGSAFS